MTSDGSAYVRFKRALEIGTELLLVAAARELMRIALDDALHICLELRDGDPGRYQRAAVRWLWRFALEPREVTIEDLRLAAEALDALRDRTAEPMERLQGLCVGIRSESTPISAPMRPLHTSGRRSTRNAWGLLVLAHVPPARFGQTAGQPR